MSNEYWYLQDKYNRCKYEIKVYYLHFKYLVFIDFYFFRYDSLGDIATPDIVDGHLVLHSEGNHCHRGRMYSSVIHFECSPVNVSTVFYENVLYWLFKLPISKKRSQLWWKKCQAIYIDQLKLILITVITNVENGSRKSLSRN